MPVSLRSCFGSSGGGSTNSGISASAVAGDDGSDLISLSADGVSEGDAGEDEVGDASEGASADGGGRRALAKGRVSRRTLRPEQPFRLPKLTLHWDSWTTSQMVTTAAAIILSEKLGFEINLEAGRTPKEMFAANASHVEWRCAHGIRSLDSLEPGYDPKIHIQQCKQHNPLTALQKPLWPIWHLRDMQPAVL